MLPAVQPMRKVIGTLVFENKPIGVVYYYYVITLLLRTGSVIGFYLRACFMLSLLFIVELSLMRDLLVS